MSRESFTVSLGSAADVTAVEYGADRSARIGVTLMLGHGAGAPQTSRFMVDFAAALAQRGVDVVTFNFPYMEQGRRVPDRPQVLESCCSAVIDAVRERSALRANRLALGGKSMGGRIATHVAAGGVALPLGAGPPRAPDLCGLVLLGYPLHPPGRPEKLRSTHLPRVAVPMLFVQGERDTFGSPEELRPVLATLPAGADLHVVAGGDHSFKVPARHVPTQADVYAEVQDRIAEWLRQKVRLVR